jgi:uncharacterized protein
MLGRETQDDVFAFLAQPSCHGGVRPQRIDTHISVVFLAGQRAYKIKRTIHLPFLDFSTLEKRENACHAEIEANHAFAPDLYRGVVAITREADGRLALGGTGSPVEWAVEMRRFDETRTLDRLAEDGAIDLVIADDLARTVALAHTRAPVVDAVPWIAALESYVGQNDSDFREHPDLFPGTETEHLTRQSDAVLARIRSLLVRRGQLGLVRRGRGDLHLGNIALIGGRPVRFDALEFDPIVAWGDMLYDLAFLLMDPRRAQAAAGCQRRAQSLSRRNPSRGGLRCAGGSTLLHVHARRHPSQSEPRLLRRA